MKEERIAGIPLFASLSGDEVRHLTATLQEQELPEHVILFQEGEVQDQVYILLEGQVEVIKALGETGERLLGVRGIGTVFGEMSLFNPEGRRSATVRSRTPVRLLEIPRPEFEGLLSRHPALAVELLRIQSARLEASENATILDLLEKNQQLAHAYQELQAAQEQIIEKEILERELELARQMQRSLLPRRLPQAPGVQFGARMVPARAVGGDFYDFYPLRNGRLGIVAGDVSDKGMAAALFMSLSTSLIRAEASRSSSAARALLNVNKHLIHMDVSTMFVTVLYGVLDYETCELRYVRAGHPPPLVLNGQCRVVEVPFEAGQPLGIFGRPLLDEQSVTLPAGGMLLLYSDGLTEAADMQGQEFGLVRALEVIQAYPRASAQEICDCLWERLVEYSRPLPQQDDVTLLCLKSVQP